MQRWNKLMSKLKSFARKHGTIVEYNESDDNNIENNNNKSVPIIQNSNQHGSRITD